MPKKKTKQNILLIQRVNLFSLMSYARKKIITLIFSIKTTPSRHKKKTIKIFRSFSRPRYSNCNCATAYDRILRVSLALIFN